MFVVAWKGEGGVLGVMCIGMCALECVLVIVLVTIHADDEVCRAAR